MQINAQPLAQIAEIVRQATREGTQINQAAASVLDLAARYERGQISQEAFLKELQDLALKINEEEISTSSQSWHMIFFLSGLILIQLKEL